jgi:hypothetical protein
MIIYNELLSRGEEIQSKINDKKNEIQSKGKKIIGLGSEKSQKDKLAQLNIAVDHLTTVVANVMENAVL